MQITAPNPPTNSYACLDQDKLPGPAGRLDARGTATFSEMSLLGKPPHRRQYRSPARSYRPLRTLPQSHRPSIPPDSPPSSLSSAAAVGDRHVGDLSPGELAPTVGTSPSGSTTSSSTGPLYPIFKPYDHILETCVIKAGSQTRLANPVERALALLQSAYSTIDTVHTPSEVSIASEPSDLSAASDRCSSQDEPNSRPHAPR